MTTQSKTPLLIDQPHHWIIQLPPALGGKGVYSQRKFCLMASDNPMAAYEDMIVFLCEQLASHKRALDVAVEEIRNGPASATDIAPVAWKSRALARIEAARSDQ